MNRAVQIIAECIAEREKVRNSKPRVVSSAEVAQKMLKRLALTDQAEIEEANFSDQIERLLRSIDHLQEIPANRWPIYEFGKAHVQNLVGWHADTRLGREADSQGYIMLIEYLDDGIDRAETKAKRDYA